tara:strand:+ start:880 stop:2604 length:1725 start_codon:yes stop_codon:yes gene_type:complete
MATDNTYYIDTSLFSTATAVWSDSALTTKAPDGWYQAPTETTVTYRQQTGGTLGTAANCECPVACGSNISGSGNVGSYVIDIDMGNTTADVGAIIVYFQPYNIPDGILATFDSTTYNTLTTNAHGIELATAGEINFVGTPTGGCTASDLEGSSTTVSNYTYNGTAFVDTGTDTTIVIPSSGTVNLNATGNIFYTMVIPKPNATPSNLRLQLVGVCGSTAFQFDAICPTALPSFTTNTVQTNPGLACSATQDQTYYFARNSSSVGQTTPVPDSNTVPQVGNFVFSNNTGTTALADGFYKLDAASNTVAQVVSGVVSAISTCPTNTAFASSSTAASISAACTDTIDQTFYHNGSGTLPSVGDNAYSDAGGTTPLSAGFYKINATSYIEITGSAGLVSGPSSFALGVSFSSSTSQASGTDACAASLTTTFYHNGSGTLPVASDTCYTDACKTITLPNGLYKITTANGGSYITITGGSGVVASVTNCSTCTSYPSSTATNFGSICDPGATPTADQTYYHNGSGTYPVNGDTVYTTIGCSNPLNGGNSYFYIYSVGSNNFYIRVDSNGLVILDSSCTPP